MIKLVVSAAALSFALVSAAWALPAAPRSELPTLNQSDIIQIGKKDRGHDGRRHGDYGGGKHYRGRSYHGGRLGTPLLLPSLQLAGTGLHPRRPGLVLPVMR